MEALLDVASHPDDAIAAMSFNFWHRLARALTIGLHPEPLGERGGGQVGVGAGSVHPPAHESALSHIHC